MKIIMLVVSAFLFIPQASNADGTMKHGSSEAKSEVKSDSDHHAGMQGELITLRGRLIGMTCFVKHGATGDSHKQCAKTCAESGLPIGLKVAGKGIFVISGEGHATPKEINTPLLKYLEGEVIVQGKTFQKEGIRLIVIEKIKNA